MLKSKCHGRFPSEVRAAYRAVHQAVATDCKEPIRSRVLCTKRALRDPARLFEMPPQTHEQLRDRFAHVAFEHFVEQGECEKTSSPMNGPFIVDAGSRSTARARSSAAASDCAMRCTAANADSNSYYRIHWPEMRVQEVVDTINELRREPNPTTSLSMGKPAKTGSILALPDFLKCLNRAFYIGTLSCKSGQNRRCPADSELPMHR